MYTVFLFIIVLVFQLRGTSVWARSLDDFLDWDIPVGRIPARRQPQQPQQVSAPPFQPTVQKSQLLGGRLKKGENVGDLSAETASMTGSKYVSSPATAGGPPHF